MLIYFKVPVTVGKLELVPLLKKNEFQELLTVAPPLAPPPPPPSPPPSPLIRTMFRPPQQLPSRVV